MAAEFLIEKSKILPEILIITPNKFSDLRGDIWSIFAQKDMGQLLPGGLSWVLDKFTFSHYNVLRGIHGDHKSYKLVTCAFGEILAVVVDCRKDSPNYLKHDKFIINADSPKMLFIPPMFGNSQYVRSKNGALYFYKWAYEGDYMDADAQFTYAWDDPKIGADWGLLEKEPILSERDKNPNH